MGARSNRIRDCLERHPNGLCIDNLVRDLEPASSLRQRADWLRALNRMEAAGLVVITGPRTEHQLAGALVRYAGANRPDST
jgi:hypothetical protein